MQNVHFQSSNKEWETPQELFLPLKERFNIVLDVCATVKNSKCKAYFDKKANGLTADWALVNHFGVKNPSCWMNPPYGRGIEHWVRKAHEESLKGVTTVALLPARTDTSWFHGYIHNKHEVRFIKGRIKFVDAPSSAPFPSMIVIFRPKKINKIKEFIWKKLKW
jgi:site-specific DNA-methyltransferase (adenine-specific)